MVWDDGRNEEKRKEFRSPRVVRVKIAATTFWSCHRRTVKNELSLVPKRLAICPSSQQILFGHACENSVVAGLTDGRL